MKIRQFISTDLNEITDIYNASKLDELKFEKEEFTLIAFTEDKFRKEIFFKSNVYVFFAENSVQGFIGFIDKHITFLFVSPNHRRKGIGKELIQFIKLKIPTNITLNVVKSNVSAQKLYAQLGFKITKEYNDSYNGINVVVNQLVFLK